MTTSNRKQTKAQMAEAEAENELQGHPQRESQARGQAGNTQPPRPEAQTTGLTRRPGSHTTKNEGHVCRAGLRTPRAGPAISLERRPRLFR